MVVVVEAVAKARALPTVNPNISYICMIASSTVYMAGEAPPTLSRASAFSETPHLSKYAIKYSSYYGSHRVIKTKQYKRDYKKGVLL